MYGTPARKNAAGWLCRIREMTRISENSDLLTQPFIVAVIVLTQFQFLNAHAYKMQMCVGCVKRCIVTDYDY